MQFCAVALRLPWLLQRRRDHCTGVVELPLTLQYLKGELESYPLFCIFPYLGFFRIFSVKIFCLFLALYPRQFFFSRKMFCHLISLWYFPCFDISKLNFYKLIFDSPPLVVSIVFRLKKPFSVQILSRIHLPIVLFFTSNFCFFVSFLVYLTLF